MTNWFEPPSSEDQAPVPGLLEQRVSDAERDQTVTQLREHVVAGRLTLDEFSERVGLALAARTHGDLSAAMAHLPTLGVAGEAPSARRARRRFIAVMSGAQAKGRWRISGRATAVAVMGGCDLDLRHAEIDGPEVVITAIAFWGGIQITVPEGFDVDLEGFSFMGGRDLKLRNVPRVPGSPRIRVRGFAIMGGIDVKSKPSRTGREIGQSIVGSVLDTVGAFPSVAAASAPGAGPIDLEALRRDIKEQFRAQRKAGRARNDGSTPPGPGAGAEARDHPPVPATVEGASSAPAAPVGRGPGEGTVTILFSDMVDYAGMTERLGDRVSREVMRDHHQIVRQALQTHGGREIKVQGDGFMVAFGGVARALRCATDIQQACASYSESHRDRPIRVHIGVHTGEAMEEDDDFLGHTVIVASRIADVAPPGEVLVSSLTAQMVERSEEFTFADERAITLKGLTRPQQVARLAWSA